MDPHHWGTGKKSFFKLGVFQKFGCYSLCKIYGRLAALPTPLQMYWALPSWQCQPLTRILSLFEFVVASIKHTRIFDIAEHTALTASVGLHLSLNNEDWGSCIVCSLAGESEMTMIACRWVRNDHDSNMSVCWDETGSSFLSSVSSDWQQLHSPLLFFLDCKFSLRISVSTNNLWQRQTITMAKGKNSGENSAVDVTSPERESARSG